MSRPLMAMMSIALPDGKSGSGTCGRSSCSRDHRELPESHKCSVYDTLIASKAAERCSSIEEYTVLVEARTRRRRIVDNLIVMTLPCVTWI